MFDSPLGKKFESLKARILSQASRIIYSKTDLTKQNLIDGAFYE